MDFHNNLYSQKYDFNSRFKSAKTERFPFKKIGDNVAEMKKNVMYVFTKSCNEIRPPYWLME
jgi:hypothetical protein